MSRPRYLQVDVFCERAGGGNPLGVVFDANDWTAEAMQRFAAWTGLVETTFVLAPTHAAASYRLRIFTPGKEIPFAGHPTVGSAHAALATGAVEVLDGKLVQECAAGLLPIRVEGAGEARRIFVQAPAANILSEGDGDGMLREILGALPRGALAPAFVEGGRRWWLAEIAHESDLRAWKPDHAAMGELARASDSLGLCVFARPPVGAPYQLVVRAFPAGVGIVEDPASGAANGLIAAYIAQRDHDRSLAHGYRVSQGREIGHDATIDIRIEAGGAVWVGGRSWTIVDGVLERSIDA